jgi:RimJ/RimL family protein N-acetyltransferase
MQLETKRLVLREWRKGDVKDLIEGLNNLDVSKWLAFAPHLYTKKDAEEWISRCRKDARKGKERDSYEFAIELKSERKVIGGTGLIKINRFQGIAGGGIWLNAKYHRKGYGSEAFDARLRFAFDGLRLRRIENGFFKGNTFSSGMQKRFGYRIEGMKRKAYICMADGKTKDEYLTGLLKEDWKPMKAR